MKRGIPRPGGIPRPAGTRLPQYQQPVAVARATAVQAPRRVLAPLKTALKVRSAPVIAAAPKPSRIIARGPAPQLISKPIPVVRKLQAPRQTVLPSRLTRPAFGLSRQVPRAAPRAAPVAQPVVVIPASPVSIPTSPVRVGNTIVMVPDEVVQVTPQRSPVRVFVTPPRTPPSAAGLFAYSPGSPLDSTVAPDEFSCLSPPSPVGQRDYSTYYSPVLDNQILTLAPGPAYSPVQSLFTYGYGDVSPLESEIMPEEFSMLDDYDLPSTSIFNEAVLLQSPSNGQPVVLDMAVSPQPIVTTTSGDHVVCDFSLNLRDPMLSPVGFRSGHARESVARGLFDESLLGLESSIQWARPEDLVNEYNNRIDFASQYQDDDLIYFSPTDLIDFGSPVYETDLMSFW